MWWILALKSGRVGDLSVNGLCNNWYHLHPWKMNGCNLKITPIPKEQSSSSHLHFFGFQPFIFQMCVSHLFCGWFLWNQDQQMVVPHTSGIFFRFCSTQETECVVLGHVVALVSGLPIVIKTYHFLTVWFGACGMYALNVWYRYTYLANGQTWLQLLFQGPLAQWVYTAQWFTLKVNIWWEKTSSCQSHGSFGNIDFQVFFQLF